MFLVTTPLHCEGDCGFLEIVLGFWLFRRGGMDGLVVMAAGGSSQQPLYVTMACGYCAVTHFHNAVTTTAQPLSHLLRFINIPQAGTFEHVHRHG